MRPQNAHELFEVAKDHLLRQGEKSVDSAGICAYRGKGGRKCAVGIFISDEDYHPDMENKPMPKLIADYPACRWMKPYQELLADLQELHDSNPPILWGEELDKLEQRLQTRHPDAHTGR